MRPAQGHPEVNRMNNFNSDLLAGKHRLHFIGIGGSGMYPLVQILAARGYEISGSDVNEGSILDTERAMGIQVYMGQRAENVAGADLVIYSAAIHPDNPELAAAVQQGIPTAERSVLLGYVAQLYPNPICIAGTHGKTTVTAMMTQVFEMAGKDPAAVIGGKLPLIDGYGKNGKGREIIIEACEYARTFLHLAPSISVLLNIDADHLEYYGSMENLKDAFRRFCLLTTDTIVANTDDANTYDVVKTLDRHVRTIGIQCPADFTARNICEYKPGFYSFDVMELTREYAHIQLSVPGYHHIYNALAVCAVARLCRLSGDEVARGIEAFTGAGRRFEIMGEVNGITIADDYAHHPTELRATLTTAKELGFKEVWAVFQPYTFSRTEMLLDEFAEVLPIADHVVVTRIMGGREKEEDYTVKAEDLTAKMPGSVCVQTFEEVKEYILSHAQPGDLVLTLGCGDLYKAAKMMLE